ncbi:hypothetical protein Pfo_027868 [Paulownia fortunei]|nr:hypothetical protein Pfo_027868 [Paulownia fortunei]
MECNRDEAIRAKSIAEGKLEQKDFVGAKKFALKAQTLYPGLDGISQMLTTLDVYVSAENKVSGEVDWYGVLGLNPSADDETIKKQYRKLALMLHPDKNNSIGADGAFKLISEAWSLLSDKAKRLAYNQRRGYKGFQQKAPSAHTAAPSAHTAAPSAHTAAPSAHTGGPSASTGGPSARTGGPSVRTGGQSAHTGGPSVRTGGPSVHIGDPSAPSRASQFFNFARRKTSAPKSKNKSAKVPSTPTPTPSYQRTDTFWTICHQCNMQYEYLKIYRNNTLLCPNCRQPFMALETAPPLNFSKSPKPATWQRQQNSSDNLPSRNAYDPGRNVSAAQKSGAGQAGPNSSRYANYPQGPLSGTASIDSRDPSITAKAANVVQQAQDKLKRAYTESHASPGWEGCSKKRKLDDDSSIYGMKSNMAQGNGSFGTASASGSRIYGFSGTNHQPNTTRELTPIETRNLLMVKAQKEILKKLSESSSETTAKAADKQKDKTKESNKERYRNTSNSQGHHNNDNSVLSAAKIAEQAEKRRARRSADNASKEYPTAVTMNVPDPDFHDFDKDRTESSFADNEVWAAYDDDDGMPRFYALINKVISRKPFKVRISWLNSKTNSEFSSIDWVGSGFYKTCGEFRVGRYETCKFINAFSQKVNWSKGPRGGVLILPQKGDVWALYKNWSSDWNEHTPDEVIHKYDMVIVLDDYSEEQGVSVAPLVKVVGFRTVFRPNLDSEVIKRTPKEEMFRFSHRVPHHLLTSQEAENVPKGCLELDPAATPLELLQMITETNEVPVVPSKGKVDTGAMQSVPVTSLDEIADGINEPRAVNIEEQSRGQVGRAKQTSQGDETECIQAIISSQV